MKYIKNTSWDNVNEWYGNKVGEKGHYYQRNIIFPRILELIDFNKNIKILDLGCGEGVFSRYLGEKDYRKYLGIDLAKNLIEQAKAKNKDSRNEFLRFDVTRRLNLDLMDFDYAVFILSLQNIDDYDSALKNASNLLRKNGKLLIVLNHPSFRIPKSSSWELDRITMRQYRRIYRYMTEHKIRIDMTPGIKQKSEYTYTFHRSLQDYSLSLFNNGFVIERIYEWTSDKESSGSLAYVENFARNEIPMFMCLVADKI